jgi:hypothetical protein
MDKVHVMRQDKINKAYFDQYPVNRSQVFANTKQPSEGGKFETGKIEDPLKLLKSFPAKFQFDIPPPVAVNRQRSSQVRSSQRSPTP